MQKPLALHSTDPSSRMSEDLNLIGDRYSLIILVFFIPYVLFQPPATVAIRKLGPRHFLAAITVHWGASMIVCWQLFQSSRAY